MTHADAELVEWLRGQIDVWEKSDAGSPECAQAYLQISAKGLSTARILLAQSAEIAWLREALVTVADGDYDDAYSAMAIARAALETKG